MISRTSILAALFAVFATATLAGAAEYQTRRVDAAAATAVATVQLPTVVVTARRIAADA
jgi:hypothetical protein